MYTETIYATVLLDGTVRKINNDMCKTMNINGIKYCVKYETDILFNTFDTILFRKTDTIQLCNLQEEDNNNNESTYSIFYKENTIFNNHVLMRDINTNKMIIFRKKNYEYTIELIEYSEYFEFNNIQRC